MTHHNQKKTALTCNNVPSVKRRRVTSRALLPVMLLSVAVPITTLGGCAKHSTNNFTVGSTPTTYKEKHPIVLSEQEQTLDIPISSQTYSLPKASASAVRGFTSEFTKSASGAITIMLPSGSINEMAGRKVGDEIAVLMESKGVPANRISVVTYNATEHGSAAPIRLSYGAVTASVGECGKWKRDLADNNENANYHNFGCASQTNLAAIISNPADLNGPRGSTGIDAARRGKVIEKYRAGDDSSSDTAFPTIRRVFSKNLD